MCYHMSNYIHILQAYAHKLGILEMIASIFRPEFQNKNVGISQI